MTFRTISVVTALLFGCTQPSPQADIAAKIGAQQVTLAQVDAQVQIAEPQTWQALFDARQRAVTYLVDEQLLTAEARTQGIEVDSLVTREIAARAATVDEGEVEAFYAQNEQSMRGQPLESMRDRIRGFLTESKLRQAQQEYLTVLRQQAGVEILLELPRAQIQLADDEPARGPTDAPIVLVEYSDYECPYCARAQASVQQVLQTYGDKVRLVYRDFPLSNHANAHLAAQAGLCANEQNRFWDYHDMLYANADALTPADLRRYATDLDLDPASFAECLDSGRFAGAVDADLESGQQYGVSGTPAFFINGRLLSGAQPFAAFQKIIDEELALVVGAEH
jgi:protein-disulfide isomerase